jgi:hypothetical protein
VPYAVRFERRPLLEGRKYVVKGQEISLAVPKRKIIYGPAGKPEISP